MKRLLAVAGLIAVLTPVLASAQCLKYEPNVVSLSGVIVLETHPGRPNFSSIAEGDEPETIWVLKLEKPICVFAANDIDVEERDQKEIQLALSDKQYSQYRNLLGRRVTVTGSLFHSVSGHHHKTLLLMTRKIRRRGAP
ncbi:MAG TPA: DUF4431 domain-containing protein [Blastocatellia bacterium]